MQVAITALICIYYKCTTPLNILFVAQDLAPETLFYCHQTSHCAHALRKVDLLPRILPICESLPLHESRISFPLAGFELGKGWSNPDYFHDILLCFEYGLYCHQRPSLIFVDILLAIFSELRSNLIVSLQIRTHGRSL